MDSDYVICLDRANEFVLAAELCLPGYRNAATTRAYYGALHAAIAALAYYTQDLKVMTMLEGRVHERVPAEFDGRFVKKSNMFRQQRGVLHTLREHRHTADYGHGVNASKARTCVEQARGFLNAVEQRMKADEH